MARLAQGTSVTVATLLSIPDAIALVASSPTITHWTIRLMEIWLAALILWFLSFLAIMHAVRLLGYGITIDNNGLRLWRFGKRIPWEKITAMTVEPQEFFSRAFCLGSTARRLTLFVTGSDRKKQSPQFLPSFLFDSAEFDRLIGLISERSFGIQPAATEVVLFREEHLPAIRKTFRLLHWQRIALSVVIAVGLTMFLGRKAAVHYLYSAGNRAFAHGQMERARNDYEFVLAIDPSFAVAWHNLAGAEFRMGNIDRARECWQQAIFLKPDLVDARVSLAYLYLQQRKFEKARTVLKAALKFAPHHIPTLINLADLDMRLGHVRSAMQTARLILTYDPRNRLAQCLIAQGRLKMGRPEDALQMFKQPKTHEDTFCLLVQGEVYLQMGQLDKAAVLFEEVRQKSPANVDVLIDLARVRVQQHDYVKADWLLRRAAEMAAGNPWIWVVRATMEADRGNKDIAKGVLQRAAMQVDQDAGSLAAEAGLALRLGDPKLAMDLADKSLKLEPVTPNALTVLEQAKFADLSGR